MVCQGEFPDKDELAVSMVMNGRVLNTQGHMGVNVLDVRISSMRVPGSISDDILVRMGSYAETAAQAVKDVSDGSGVLLDVRRDDEWNSSHARGAMHVPITALEQGKAPDIPKDKKIYTYCQAGGRAGRAAAMLKGMGYKHVTSIGGLNDWLHAGGDVGE